MAWRWPRGIEPRFQSNGGPIWELPVSDLCRSNDRVLTTGRRLANFDSSRLSGMSSQRRIFRLKRHHRFILQTSEKRIGFILRLVGPPLYRSVRLSYLCKSLYSLRRSNRDSCGVTRDPLSDRIRFRGDSIIRYLTGASTNTRSNLVLLDPRPNDVLDLIRVGVEPNRLIRESRTHELRAFRLGASF